MASSKPLVLLTGSSGFVGAHVLSALLKAGYAVKAPLRSLSKGTYLLETNPTYKSDITFIHVPDLQSPGALDSAVADVDFICHVASPYFTSTTDPIGELVNPAVEGTKNVINSAVQHGTKLKKFLILSSFASVNDVSKAPRAGYLYNEEDWNPVTMAQAATNGMLGYGASKTFAERAAWELWRAAKEKGEIAWDLVAFNPPMIYGPPVHEVDVAKGIEGLNTSMLRILLGITGRDPSAAPKVAKPGLPHWIDVRDVASAHVKALALEGGVSERFLLCSSVRYYEDGLTGLRARGVKGLGEEGEKCDVTGFFGINTTKARSVLGIEFIPFEKTVEDIWAWATDVGLIKA